jgi:hypothetical protein
VIALGSWGPAARADFLFTHGDHTYRVVTTPAPWAEAAAAARSLTFGGQPGYLTHIDDAAENAAIAAQLLANIPAADFPLTRAPDGGNGSYVWIGAQDLAVEGTWVWDGDFDGVGSPLGTGTFSTWVTAPGAYQNWRPATGAGQRRRQPGRGRDFLERLALRHARAVERRQRGEFAVLRGRVQHGRPGTVLRRAACRRRCISGGLSAIAKQGYRVMIKTCTRIRRM